MITPLYDSLRESRFFSQRVLAVAIAVGVLTGLLLLRLIWLQVVSHRHYETLSQENRINPVPIPPVRGLILDRNGAILAENRPVLTLEIVPDQVKDMDGLLRELGEVIELNTQDLEDFRRLVRQRPRFESIPLRVNLTDAEAARFAVVRYRLRGVDLKARLERFYPQGGLGVHALGYVGRINADEEKRIDPNRYRGTQHIGKLGVEAQYEEQLHGIPGIEKVETDAHGRALRTIERVSPVAGQNLHLNLDARMQAAAELGLGGFKGAVIALNPRTGAVYAFASNPTFDPNPFVNGISAPAYASLRDDPDKPLLNRALNGRYSPGSTIKAFLGLAAIEIGDGPNARVNCPGWYSLPGSSHRFRCWKKEGHGSVDLHDAVVQSCDVYFYRLAVQLGPERLSNFLARFGFGARTGVDMPGESSGLLPTPEWKRARGVPWYPGDTVVAGIGQGLIIFTPLQMAVATAAIANRGSVLEPRLAAAIEDPLSHMRTTIEPNARRTMTIADAHFAIQIANLADVVHGTRGTARGIGLDAPYQIAGKTGTAQVRSIAQGAKYNEAETPLHLRDHALFVAFAPVEDPKIAVAVIMENGGHGGSAAAPVARKVMDVLLVDEARTSAAGTPAGKDGAT